MLFEAAIVLWILAAALTFAAHLLAGTIIGIPAAIAMLNIAALMASIGFALWIAANVAGVLQILSVEAANRLRGDCVRLVAEVQEACPENCRGDLSLPECLLT